MSDGFKRMIQSIGRNSDQFRAGIRETTRAMIAEDEFPTLTLIASLSGNGPAFLRQCDDNMLATMAALALSALVNELQEIAAEEPV